MDYLRSLLQITYVVYYHMYILIIIGQRERDHRFILPRLQMDLEPILLSANLCIHCNTILIHSSQIPNGFNVVITDTKKNYERLRNADKQQEDTYPIESVVRSPITKQYRS